MERLWSVLWILFLISAFAPLIQARLLEYARLRAIRGLERRRRSRVVTLIHRQELRTVLGIPVARFKNAVLGPVDPQVGEYPAASLLRVIREKDRNELEDKTLILADLARKATAQIQECVEALVRDRMAPEQAKELIAALTEGHWTHDYPITVGQAARLGLPVRTDLPAEVYALMELYPQPRQARPSVQFVPVPYRREVTPAAWPWRR
jgi:ClpP class serine protease